MEVLKVIFKAVLTVLSVGSVFLLGFVLLSFFGILNQPIDKTTFNYIAVFLVTQLIFMAINLFINKKSKDKQVDVSSDFV